MCVCVGSVMMSVSNSQRDNACAFDEFYWTKYRVDNVSCTWISFAMCIADDDDPSGKSVKNISKTGNRFPYTVLFRLEDFYEPRGWRETG